LFALVHQSILEQLKSIFSGMEPLPPNRIPPTVGLNIGRVRVNRSSLIFWDVGGQRSLRTLWEKYGHHHRVT
jgi:ADP-ribosylation factor related protein 1